MVLSDHVVISPVKKCVREQLTYTLGELFRSLANNACILFDCRKRPRTLDLTIIETFFYVFYSITNRPEVLCQQSEQILSHVNQAKLPKQLNELL